MLSKIQATLDKLLSPGEPLLVGVSGGPDSVALLDVLVKSGWHPHICHLNHQLRGADSDADAVFVRQLAAHYDLPSTIEACKVARAEDSARRARHDFFARVSAATGIKKLALAHTADDQVETFLLRLLRGAGVPGLVGIWPERQFGTLRVIRPLLKVRRLEIMEYLSAEGLKYREDASNADTRFTRNRIRHELLPLLEREFNPAVRDVLLRTAEVLGEEDAVLQQHAVKALHQVARADSLNVGLLTKLHVAMQRRVIRLWLRSDVNFDHIEAVRELAGSDCPSAEAHLTDDLVAYREYEWLRKARREELELVRGKWPLDLQGETVIRELSVRFVAECTPHVVVPFPEQRQGGVEPPHSKEESFDADALGSAPFIRTWEEGDRFQPLGMNEEKKLQDFFVDEKVPRRNRARVPLFCATDGRIAWVVSHRMAESFKVTERTGRVLRIQCLPQTG